MRSFLSYIHTSPLQLTALLLCYSGTGNSTYPRCATHSIVTPFGSNCSLTFLTSLARFSLSPACGALSYTTCSKFFSATTVPCRRGTNSWYCICDSFTTCLSITTILFASSREIWCVPMDGQSTSDDNKIYLHSVHKRRSKFKIGSEQLLLLFSPLSDREKNGFSGMCREKMLPDNVVIAPNTSLRINRKHAVTERVIYNHNRSIKRWQRLYHTSSMYFSPQKGVFLM